MKLNLKYLTQKGGPGKLLERLLEKFLDRIFRSWDDAPAWIPARMKIVPPFVYDLVILFAGIILINQMIFLLITWIR
jgi:hypothetical protein